MLYKYTDRFYDVCSKKEYELTYESIYANPATARQAMIELNRGKLQWIPPAGAAPRDGYVMLVFGVPVIYTKKKFQAYLDLHNSGQVVAAALEDLDKYGSVKLGGRYYYLSSYYYDMREKGEVV